ncbi:MAG: trigger factor [Bdellovibrionales bacterium]|nr:trigger factor [Bdellovibrionales bacterium]
MEFSVKVEETSKIKRKLTITVRAASVDLQVQEHLAEAQKKARLKGFRPGKVPLTVVKKFYGEDVKYRALNALVDVSFREAVTKENLRPVGRPAIESASPDNRLVLEEGKDLTYTAIVEVLPEVKAKDYKGLKIERPSADVTDEDVKRVVQQVRDTHAEMMTVDEERPVKKGDFVDMKFEGGVVTAEGTVEKRPDMGGQRVLEVGGGDLIPGFEDHLVGMKRGDKKTFRIAFPADYHATELAGKEAEFAVEVFELKAKKLPELNEEFAKEAGYDSIADMNTKIREGMGQHKKEEADRKLKSDVLEQLIAKNPFDVPESLIQAQARHLLEEFVRDLKRSGFSEQMVQQALTSELDNLRKRAENQVRAGLLLDSISKIENLHLADGDYALEYDKMAKSMNVPEKEIRDYYEKDPTRKENLEFRLREQKTLNFIQEHAKMK